MSRSSRFALLAVIAGALLLGVALWHARAGTGEVPFGDKVSAAITYYNRTQPTIATGGTLKPGAIEELERLGFKTIVDLRTPEEGTAEEEAVAKAAGLAYFNIPIGSDLPTEAQVRQFAALVEDEANAPMLVHCVAADRVGEMWALYRVSRGIPADIALMEGRTIGMKSGRENAVRAALEETRAVAD